MAFSIKCTNCGAVLKAANPIAPGKKVKCPKCTKLFVVEPEEEEEPEAKDIDTSTDEESGNDEDEAPAPKKPAKAAAKDDDEDEEAEDDDEEKPKSRKPARASDDEEGDDDDDSPKKKGKREDDDQGDDEKPKKKTGMIIAIILVVLLLCCCVPGGGATWFFWEVISRTMGFVDAVQKDLKKLDEKGAKAPNRKDEDTKPAFTLAALAMTQEFLDNEKAAAAKYVGRMVEVTGEVWIVNDKKSFTIKGAKKDAKDMLGISIVCDVPPHEEANVGRLVKDGQVKVVGTVRSVAFGAAIQLADCTVIESGPPKK